MARIKSIADYFDGDEDEKDIERIADSVWSDSRGGIIDRDTFDAHFKDFMGETTSIQEKVLRPAVFRKLREKHEEVDRMRIFSKAGGKNLRLDQRKTHSKVLTDKQEFIKTGASKSDLKGLDTKRKVKRPKSAYTIPAKRRGKIVLSRRTFVVVAGKRRLRYRDELGRFVSVRR